MDDTGSEKIIHDALHGVFSDRTRIAYEDRIRALEKEREDLRRLVKALTKRVEQLEPRGL